MDITYIMAAVDCYIVASVSVAAVLLIVFTLCETRKTNEMID